MTNLEPNLMIELVNPNAKMPTRGTEGSVGLDVYTPEDYMIPARGHAKVSLGWRCQFNNGWTMLVFNKSGLSSKRGLDKGAEVIDPDYRGEVHIHLFNNTDDDVYFETGDKIAQILLIPVWTGLPIQGVVSNDTERGTGGFGSTGER